MAFFTPFNILANNFLPLNEALVLLRNGMQKCKDSYIYAEFEGWDVDFIYELDDGSKWELTSNTYSIYYSYRPKAIVWRDGGRYYLEVANMSGKQEVRQV
ncbi:MAG: hypothetical protein ACJAS1_006223 [Oleiphilaceae bacterium]